MKKHHTLLLTILFIACITYITLHIYWFSNEPECFFKAYEVGQIVNKLCLSYIAAFIFYLVVNYLPQRKRRKKLLENLDTQINVIENCLNQILKELNYQTDQETLTIDNITQKELKNVLLNTSPKHKSSINYPNNKNASILKVIEVNFKVVQNEYLDLEKHYDLYSVNLYKLLKERIRDKSIHTFPVGLKMIAEISKTNQQDNLGLFDTILFSYIENTKEFISEWKKNKN
ncbi:hypothetical protein [Tenacibaculum aestuarii]|uniref:hypothetical protein n=1 Tax=Tenacibaculum aestuarii TaxID=362781 RepID=UPI0038945950